MIGLHEIDPLVQRVEKLAGEWIRLPPPAPSQMHNCVPNRARPSNPEEHVVAVPRDGQCGRLCVVERVAGANLSTQFSLDTAR